MAAVITLAEAKAQKLRRYFTGVPCAKGHVAERLTSAKACCECMKLAKKAYRERVQVDPKAIAKAEFGPLARWMAK